MACLLSSDARTRRRRQRLQRRVQAFLINALFFAVFSLLGAWALSLKPAHAQYSYPGGYPGTNSGYPGTMDSGSIGTTGGTNSGYPGTNSGYPGSNTGSGTTGSTGMNTGYPGSTNTGSSTGYPGGNTGGTNTASNSGYPGATVTHCSITLASRNTRCLFGEVGMGKVTRVWGPSPHMKLLAWLNQQALLLVN